MTYFIKNISNELVIEPHFGVQLEPGEVKELTQDVAQRILVIRPDAVRLVSGQEESKEEAQEEVKQEEIVEVKE